MVAVPVLKIAPPPNGALLPAIDEFLIERVPSFRIAPPTSANPVADPPRRCMRSRLSEEPAGTAKIWVAFPTEIVRFWFPWMLSSPVIERPLVNVIVAGGALYSIASPLMTWTSMPPRF